MKDSLRSNLASIQSDLCTFLINELSTSDLGTLADLKLSATGQTEIEQANSSILLWPENILPLEVYFRDIFDIELPLMTSLELDVSISRALNK